MSEENEKFLIYKFAKQLSRDYYFQPLFIDEAADEVWLEKKIGKKTQIIRLLPRGFDWKNHMKQDIAKVFQSVKAVRKLIANKQIEIHNIYTANNSPLDDWEYLKKPMQLKDKKPLMMHVYYFEQSGLNEELRRLSTNLQIDQLDNDTELPNNHVQLVQEWKKELQHDLHQKETEEKKLFSFGRPVFTYFFIAMNILMFLFMELHGGSQSTENLIRFGAKDNVGIIHGDWWRLLTSMFLHIGFLHLFMNMLVLYYLGTVVEKMFGSIRFLLIYMVAGTSGAVASFAFNMNVSAGASGAIFGMFGALICFGLYHRQAFLRTMGQNILFLLLINLLYGFFVPSVDVQAHLGGLAGGFLAAMILQLPKKKKGTHQMLALIICIVLFSGLYIYGVDETRHSAMFEWEQVNNLMDDQNYTEVVKHATKGLEKAPEDLKAALLFKRAYAYNALDQPDKAIFDYENSIQANPDIAETYYNLSLLYLDKGDLDKAKTAAKKAHSLAPENKDFEKMYKQIK